MYLKVFEFRYRQPFTIVINVIIFPMGVNTKT